MKHVVVRIFFRDTMPASDFITLICDRDLKRTSISEIDEYCDVSGEVRAIDKLLEEFRFSFSVLARGLGGRVYIKFKASDNLSKYDKSALYIIELISTPATRDAVIGDLLEARDKIMEQHGERKARFYFWWQVARTIGHFAYAWVRRLRWIAVALGFVGWVTRKFSS